MEQCQVFQSLLCQLMGVPDPNGAGRQLSQFHIRTRSKKCNGEGHDLCSPVFWNGLAVLV